jgi:hypothetical protein
LTNWSNYAKLESKLIGVSTTGAFDDLAVIYVSLKEKQSPSSDDPSLTESNSMDPFVGESVVAMFDRLVGLLNCSWLRFMFPRIDILIS